MTANTPHAPTHAAVTVVELRETREKAERSAAVRRVVGVKIRVAKGLMALSQKDYERAGRELGEVGEEGGLESWEGQVSEMIFRSTWSFGPRQVLIR
jgi:hypothetical protein